MEPRRLLWRKAYVTIPPDEASPIEFGEIYQSFTQIIGTKWHWVLRLKNGKDIRGAAPNTQTAADQMTEAWWLVFSSGTNRLPWALGSARDEFVARPLSRLSIVEHAFIYRNVPYPPETQWSWSVVAKDGRKLSVLVGVGSQQRAIDAATEAWWRLERGD